MNAIVAVVFCGLPVLTVAGRLPARASEQTTTADQPGGHGPAGRAAVLAGDLPTGPGAAPPERTAAVARRLGYDVRLLTPEELADPDTFNRRRYDVLIVPCAPAFPYEARRALLGFLQRGGGLVSIGGYAFDRLLARTQAGWTAVREDAEEQPEWINTRHGIRGDSIRFRPDQIGAFDPSYLLEQVDYAVTAADQFLLKEPIRIAGPLEGYAACVVAGNQSPVFPVVHGRWIPLLNGYDALGRLRGAVAAVVHHMRGPFRGSSWALVGVSNRDLLGDEPAGTRLLASLLRAVTGPAFLYGLKTDLACYRQGEPVKANVQVANHGPTPRRLVVRFAAGAMEPVPRSVSVGPGGVQSAEAVLHRGPFDRDFYRVTADLLDAESGAVIDRMVTGLVVWSEEVVRAGPRIALEENYFTIDGAPQFLCGTNQTGMIFYSENENPLVWDRDFAKMRSFGMRMLRILHFSPFAADDPPQWHRHGTEVLRNRPKRLRRQMDAVVQLAQRHGVVVFLSLHDWMPVELSDEGLEDQRQWNRFWAARYRHVPGIIYDVQNEPSVRLSRRADLVAFYNEWLKSRYPTRDALIEAWGTSGPPEDSAALVPQRGSDAWTDVRTFDAECFRAEALNRWIKPNVQGVKQGDPDALVSVGFLQSMAPADKILGARYLDFSNMHYHGDVDPFPARLKIIDRRFLGKSFSLGEFGAMEAHAARNRGKDGTAAEASVRRFLTMTHYTFGLGGSHALNWDWKDFRACVFPWGLNHCCDLVEKRVLAAFRNASLFLGRLHPRYEDPHVYLLVPDSHRLGAASSQVHAGIYRLIDALLANRVNFNVANEYDLERLPSGCRIMLWPVPYCPDDATFRRVLEFVRQGGTLYVSGDLSYDPLRRRTRTGRLADLGLKDPGARHPLEAGQQRPPTAIQRGAAGKGRVFFVASPVELTDAQSVEIIRQFLDFASAPRIAVQPEDPRLHAFTLPLTDGSVTVCCNRSGTSRQVALPEAEITVADGLTGLVATDRQGRLTAVECTGRSAFGGEPVTSGTAHVMIAGLDRRHLPRSTHLALFPITQGELTLHTAAEWHDAVLDWGQPAGTSWKGQVKLPLELDSGSLTVKIDANLVRSILVIRRENDPPGLP